MTWFTPTRRLWLYRIVSAAVLLAVGYGVITAEMSPLWIALAAAVLGQGELAAANVPRPSPDPTE